MKITCFLPCRKGSERVPRKNIKPFAGYPNGLIEIKIKQLLNSELIDEIVVSTNDEEILKYLADYKSKKLIIHKRIDSLCTGETSTDEIITHAHNLIPDSIILWTHVTSPFVVSSDYDKIIQTYYMVQKKGYDSLMTTNLIHGFLWDDNGPINYNRSIEKWPRTQTIKPIHEINSAVFINHSDNYKLYSDRIGIRPYLYNLDKIKGFDIDWNEDFIIAESIVSNGLTEL
jgi:CMP-N-acetylneuraminic acid synthetase